MFYITISGEITEETASYVIDGVLNTGDDDITICIDSEGGDIEAGVSIYNTLMSCGKNITTCVINRCMSSAVTILLAGSQRYAVPMSKLMIHKSNVSFDADVEKDVLELKELVAERRQDDYRIFRIIRDRCKKLTIPMIYKFIREAKNKEHYWYLSPATAKKYGIIHNIGWPVDKPTATNTADTNPFCAIEGVCPIINAMTTNKAE